MKNKIKWLGIIALAAVIGFGMFGCGEGPSTTTTTQGFSTSGTFGSYKFTLAQTTGNPSSYRSARASASQPVPINGRLEDGSIIFLLSGTYDPVSGNYTASASSSMIRFSINGVQDTAGNVVSSSATVLTSSDGGATWETNSYVITKAAVTISTSKPIAEADNGGIPEWARGFWSYVDDKDDWKYEALILFSQWSLKSDDITTDPDGQKTYSTQSMNVIETENKTTHWDVITSYLYYEPTKALAEEAAAKFLSGKKLTATKLDSDPFPPDSGAWWCIRDNGDFWQGGDWGGGPNGGGEGGVSEETQAEIWSIFGSNMTIAQKRTAISNVLSGAGIEATMVTLPNGLYYYFYDDGYWKDIMFGGASEAQWKTIDQWYSSNYLENYLIEKVTPQTLYNKTKIVFGNNNTELTMYPYCDELSFEWNSIAGARAATETWEDEYAFLTR